jgi:hypothetical protein
MTLPEGAGWSEGWSARFSTTIPKDELREKLRALHQDLRTPWTFAAMSRECRHGSVDRKVIERFVRLGHLTERLQIILSAFVHDIEAGRLKLYYKNPDAIRWVCKSRQKPDTGGLSRLELQKRNKVIKEYNPDAEPEEQKKLTINIGSHGVSLRPTRQQTTATTMPSVASILKGNKWPS